MERPSTEDELGDGLPCFSAKSALVGLIDVQTTTDTANIDPVLEKIKQAALPDLVHQELRKQIIIGFPNDKFGLYLNLRPYWCVRERLAVDEVVDMIVVGSKIVVPHSMRAEVLGKLGNQGATKTRLRARASVYWY